MSESKNRLNGHTPPPPPPVVLPMAYDDAIIGHSISSTARPRFAYSLTRLAELEQKRQVLATLDLARKSVWSLIVKVTQDHGDNSPLFIDDSETRKETSKIINPFAR